MYTSPNNKFNHLDIYICWQVSMHLYINTMWILSGRLHLYNPVLISMCCMETYYTPLYIDIHWIYRQLCECLYITTYRSIYILWNWRTHDFSNIVYVVCSMLLARLLYSCIYTNINIAALGSWQHNQHAANHKTECCTPHDLHANPEKSQSYVKPQGSRSQNTLRRPQTCSTNRYIKYCLIFNTICKCINI